MSTTTLFPPIAVEVIDGDGEPLTGVEVEATFRTGHDAGTWAIGVTDPGGLVSFTEVLPDEHAEVVFRAGHETSGPYQLAEIASPFIIEM